MEGPFSLDDLLSHLLVKLVFILVYLLCEVLLSIFNLLAELLNILSGFCILNDLAYRPHDIDKLAFASMGEDGDAGRFVSYRAG